MKKLVLCALAMSIAACTETPQNDAPDQGAAPAPANDDLRMVRGYRSDDDWCQLTGETPFTVNYLDDAADLVSCPTGSDAAQSLVDMYGARQVTETGGYTVYTVPRR